MVFSSAAFLFAFFPIYLLIVLCVRNLRINNILLLIMSLIFYAWGEPFYILLMLFSMLVNYLLALPAAKYANNDCIRRRTFLSIAAIFNITLLGIFKYAGFLMNTINSVCGLGLPVPNIPLPIGISFFTFQTMSYVIDAYRGTCSVQKNFGKFALYISFFPQLIAGPIVKYHDIEMQLDYRKISFEGIADGARRFFVGLAKKLIISNACAVIVDNIYENAGSDLNILIAWTAAICYCFQLYFDFSGYSDMAIGLGKMAGFKFMENFNYPYISLSVRDFWKRWHISLTTWFREYVYFPLGGNRKGELRTGLNRLTVFLLTGLWHGAQWTFVVWGLFHGIFMLLETYLIHPEKWKYKILSRIYTLVIVAVGFTIFRADNMAQALNFIASMFVGFNFTHNGLAMLCEVFDSYNVLIIITATIACTPWLKNKADGISAQSIASKKTVTCFKYAASLGLIAICILSLASSTYNPFIYFRF